MCVSRATVPAMLSGRSGRFTAVTTRPEAIFKEYLRDENH